MSSAATAKRTHGNQLLERKTELGYAATALAFTPLIAHRVSELCAGQLSSRTAALFVLHTLPPVAMLGVALAVWRRIAPLPGAARRLVAGRAGLAVAAGLLLGAGAALANLLTVLAQSSGRHGVLSVAAAAASPFAGRGPFGAYASLDAGGVALLLHIAVLAPIAEEFAFRGLIYRQLRQRVTPLLATLISATIFALMHGNLHQAMWAFGLGVVTAVAYERTGSLVAPILVHALFNAVPVAVVIARSRPDDFAPVWLVLCAMAVVFTFAARRVAQDRERHRAVSAAASA